uniref:Ig-like domain-containing protein n=1 Tax=Strix occidentalis caurina TaxID=311401 RepID=A0A8D0KYK3_STROC
MSSFSPSCFSILKGILLFSSAVAAGRAQVQQEPSAETNEGTGVTIKCSHPNIQTTDLIYWYRQLPGRGPAFLVSGHKGSKELQAPPGRLSVAADRRSSALWLARPRRGDAAVYYCASLYCGLPSVPPPRQGQTFIWGKLVTLPCSSA